MSSPDIRAGISLLIAALSAQGRSIIQNIDQIDRGYERIDERRVRLLAQDGESWTFSLPAGELAIGEDVFFAATGITDGALVRGVKYSHDGARTHSIVMRSRSGTVRRIEGQHNFDKLERFTGKDYRP